MGDVVARALAKQANDKGADLTAQLADTGKRIDQIITTPAEGISQQEIVDARQGAASLGANIRDVKDRLGTLNAYFYNYIQNGQFENLTGWDSRTSTNAVSANTLSNTGDGTGSLPYLRQTTTLKSDKTKVLYIKLRARVLNSNATTIKIGFLNPTNAWVGSSHIVDMPTKDNWYDLSVVATIPEDGAKSLTLAVQHIYSSKEVASGKVMEVQNVCLLNLTEIFGIGYEPSKEEMNQMMGKIPNQFFSGKLSSEQTQKIILDYLLGKSSILQNTVSNMQKYTDEKTANIVLPETKLTIPPISLMDYSRESWFDFESGIWTLKSSNTEVLEETENVRFGTKGMKIIKTSSANWARAILSNTTDLSQKMIVLSVYVKDTSLLKGIQFGMRAGDTAWDNQLTFTYVNDTDLKRNLHNGWNYVVIDHANLIPTGSTTRESIKSVNGIQVSLGTDNLSGAEIVIDSIFLVDKPKMEQPLVTVTFDDSFRTDYTVARPYMSKYGYLGTSYVITSVIGQNNYMTETQLRHLYDMGWDISNHTHRHTMMKDDVTPDNWIKDMNEGYQWLMSKGFRRTAEHIAYPGGYNVPETLGAVPQYHKSGRLNLGTTQTFPANQVYQLKAYNGAAPLADVKNRIDIALSRGQWLILMFHEIKDTMNGTACTEEHFKAVIDYLHQKQAKVLPMSQVIK